MKRPEPPLDPLDKRILWEAIRAAGGNVPMAARTLGLSPRDLLVQLADRKTTPPRPMPSSYREAREDDGDRPAWGDDGDTE